MQTSASLASRSFSAIFEHHILELKLKSFESFISGECRAVAQRVCERYILEDPLASNHLKENAMTCNFVKLQYEHQFSLIA